MQDTAASPAPRTKRSIPRSAVACGSCRDRKSKCAESVGEYGMMLTEPSDATEDLQVHRPDARYASDLISNATLRHMTLANGPSHPCHDRLREPTDQTGHPRNIMYNISETASQSWKKPSAPRTVPTSPSPAPLRAITAIRTTRQIRSKHHPQRQVAVTIRIRALSTAHPTIHSDVPVCRHLNSHSHRHLRQA